MTTENETFSRPYSIQETQKVAYLVHLSVLDHLARGVGIADLEKISRINKINDSVLRRSLEPKPVHPLKWNPRGPAPWHVQMSWPEPAPSVKPDNVIVKKSKEEVLLALRKQKDGKSNVILLKPCEGAPAQVK